MSSRRVASSHGTRGACDLPWNSGTQDWVGDAGQSHDSIVKRSRDRFTDLVKRTYRVVRTRGMMGWRLHIADRGMRKRVQAHLS